MMWCEALSSGGVDSPKSGSKNKSSQNPPRSGAFYISNTVESDSVNDFAIRRRSSVVNFRIFVSKRPISEEFGVLRGEIGRTAACRVDIRNLRVSFCPTASGCCPDPLCIRVTGWVCSVEISRFGEFRETGKAHIRAVFWQFGTYFQFIGPPLSGRLLVVGVD